MSPSQSSLAEHELAFVDAQVRVIESPSKTDDEEVVNEVIAGFVGVTGGVGVEGLDEPPPPPPHAEIKNKTLKK